MSPLSDTEQGVRITGRDADRAQVMLAERVEAAGETVALADWQRVELPPIARRAYPGLDLTDPSTLPEPDRCAEGRPWGPDAYGSLWTTPDQRWAAYIERSPSNLRARCRNRWKDRDTLLCGTHLNAWTRTLAEAARRVRRHEAHERATALARQLVERGVAAEANAGGVLLRLDDARALVELLDSDHAGDRAALLDVLDAVDAVLRQTVEALRDARARARRHVDRTTLTTPTPDPTDRSA